MTSNMPVDETTETEVQSKTMDDTPTTVESTGEETADEAEASVATKDEIGGLGVRDRVADITEPLLGQPFDGIPTVEAAADGGGRVLFEVVERSAVPDTQDIIGRYEVRLSSTGEIRDYSLQQRFKRGEMQGETL